MESEPIRTVRESDNLLPRVYQNQATPFILELYGIILTCDSAEPGPHQISKIGGFFPLRLSSLFYKK